MNKLFLSAAFLLTLISATSLAQTSTPEERAVKWDNWMKENLTLTPDQLVAVHPINLRYANESERLRTSDETRMKKFQTLKDIDKRKDADLKPILSAAQFKIYSEKKKEFQRQLMEKAKQ